MTCTLIKKPCIWDGLPIYENIIKAGIIIKRVSGSRLIDALEDPRDQLHFFLTFFNEAAKLHAPIMRRRVLVNDVPWKTSEINQMMEKWDNMKVEAQKTRNKDLYEQYKNLKNKTNSALGKAKGEYYKGLILENKNKPYQLWKAIKTIMPSNSKGDETTKLQDEDRVPVRMHQK